MPVPLADLPFICANCHAVMAVGLADPIREALTPPAEYFKTLDLPEALIHWGHPGNMLVRHVWRV